MHESRKRSRTPRRRTAQEGAGDPGNPRSPKKPGTRATRRASQRFPRDWPASHALSPGPQPGGAPPLLGVLATPEGTPGPLSPSRLPQAPGETRRKPGTLTSGGRGRGGRRRRSRKSSVAGLVTSLEETTPPTSLCGLASPPAGLHLRQDVAGRGRAWAGRGRGVAGRGPWAGVHSPLRAGVGMQGAATSVRQTQSVAGLLLTAVL